MSHPGWVVGFLVLRSGWVFPFGVAADGSLELVREQVDACVSDGDATAMEELAEVACDLVARDRTN